MLVTLEYLFLMLTWNLLLERYDPNHVIDWEENPIENIFFNKMLWFMVTNPFCKSISIIQLKDRNQNLFVFYPSGTKDVYLSNGSYKIPIGISIEFYYLLHIP